MLNILAWWNLMFLLPLALGVLLLVVSGLTGALDSGDTGHGDSGHADSGHGETGYGDGDADGGHADGSHDAHGEHDTDGHGFSEFLHTLGVGVVPLVFLMPGFLMPFGIFGITASRLLNVDASSGSRFWMALLIAIVFGLVSMALLGAAFRKFLPSNEPATSKKDLLGKTGKVIFGVSNTEGTIQVRDVSGTLHQLPARVRDGQEAIESGHEVLLVGFDSEHGCFIVEENPFS